MIDVKLIESFVLLMDAGSLTRAEGLSGIPKATLSRQLVKLEETMGVQLVTRGSRKLVPTEAGRAFHTHGQSILAELGARVDAARTELQDLLDGVSGQISILTDNHFSTSFMCGVTRLFLERYPNVICQFDLVGSGAPITLGEADCYVGMNPPEHPNLVVKQLGRLSCGLYASPGYLQHAGMPSSEGELIKHRAILFSRTSSQAPYKLHSKDGEFEYKPDSPVRTNDYWIMKTFCMDGFGIGLMPDYFCKPEVEVGNLVPVLSGWHPEPMRVYCAYQKQRFTGRKLRALINLVSDSFKSIDSFHYYGPSKSILVPKKQKAVG